MEGRFAGDFRIVQQRSVEPDFGSGRTAAEEIDDAAFTHQLRRKLPGSRMTDRFDDRIRAASAGMGFQNGYQSGVIPHDDTFVGAKHHGAIYLFDATGDYDHPSAIGVLCEPDEHKPDRTEAHDGKSIAGLDSRFVQTSQHASERLG